MYLPVSADAAEPARHAAQGHGGGLCGRRRTTRIAPPRSPGIRLLGGRRSARSI